MASLLELQERFAAELESEKAASARGVDVYRRAIAANYRRALAATYPVVRDLLGAAAFEEAVDAFVAAHPPVSGDLNVYGGGFPDFLERHAPGRSDARDMARLEWAIDESARAGDTGSAPAGVVAALAALGEDAAAQARLSVHPSCRLVSTEIPVYRTWSAHQGSTHRGTREDVEGEFLLVHRHAARTLVERIAAAEFTWLRALRSGETFGDALACALERDESFDLEKALGERVHDGTICGVERGRYNPRHG